MQSARVRTAELSSGPSSARRMLSLVVETAPSRPRRVPLPKKGALLLGGDWARESNDTLPRLPIADFAVSARHARVEVDEGRVRIVDLGSRNGTWVGGARVEAAQLSVGACAIVGRSVLTIESASPFEELGLDGPEDAVDSERPNESAAEDESNPEAEGCVMPGAVGRSPEMRRLAAAVRSFAGLTASALIRGESGSGKEVVARAMHELSARRAGPFVGINLGALPRELAESELFGSERGAFTGAVAARPGVFELADGGTLLLDELGELPLDMQAKLLRVLETGEVRRLGASRPRKVDVRLLAATWAPLEQRIAEGTFREDLFHRIAVLVIDVPPLRRRMGDVPALARALLASYPELAHKELTASALSRLCAESWPGNVRELRNVVYRAAALSPDVCIEAADVARALASRSGSQPPPSRATLEGRKVDEFVRAHGGNISAAARSMGVPRETMRDWLRQARR
jgi:DNA-binding NtrC family response regulator